jgi:hypothetical protein
MHPNRYPRLISFLGLGCSPHRYRASLEESEPPSSAGFSMTCCGSIVRKYFFLLSSATIEHSKNHDISVHFAFLLSAYRNQRIWRAQQLKQLLVELRFQLVPTSVSRDPNMHCDAPKMIRARTLLEPDIRHIRHHESSKASSRKPDDQGIYCQPVIRGTM